MPAPPTSSELAGAFARARTGGDATAAMLLLREIHRQLDADGAITDRTLREYLHVALGRLVNEVGWSADHAFGLKLRADQADGLRLKRSADNEARDLRVAACHALLLRRKWLPTRAVTEVAVLLDVGEQVVRRAIDEHDWLSGLGDDDLSALIPEVASAIEPPP